MERIVSPVDFSELSAVALRYAWALAKCSGAQLTALYADQFLPPPYFTENSLDVLTAQARESRERAKAYLGDFATKTLGSSATVALEVVEGLPADAIRRAAAGADLIVMGTHGRSGFNRLMLGSVTERVLRESEVPVLAVRGDADAQPQIRHILCPVNDSDAARAALRKAAQLAACTGAVVTALHVKEPGAKDSIDNLCGWIPGELRPQCEIRELSTHGEVAREVIAMASELKVDLIVLGARHKAFFDTSVIGANTIRMVRHAHSPVLMVFAT